MKIMGLDYGSKTVGVAISDSLLITAQGVETVRREREDKLRRTLARIEELINENRISLIVLGLPKNMNGSIGERAEKTLEFADILRRRTGLEVIMWDERLTTVAAHRAMSEAGIRGRERDNYVDSMAASLILQGYLDYRRMNVNDGGVDTTNE